MCFKWRLFEIKVNTALYVHLACKCCTPFIIVQVSLFQGQMLDIKDILPYSYLNLNNCLLRFQNINFLLSIGIEVTFELITCDSHSHEMSFISYLFVHLLLMSSHREISLNRTLLRHAHIYFFRLCAFDSEIWKAKIGCLHTYINIIFMSFQVTSISHCDFCIPWLHIVHIVYFVLYIVHRSINKLCFLCI